MSLTGILLDVSASMRRNIGSGIDEQGGPWAQSILKVIDDLIEHNLTSKDRVFAIGVGACCTKEIFDIIGTLREVENMEMPSYGRNMPATADHIHEILGILEEKGARNIRQWIQDTTFIQDELSDYMAALVLKKLKCDSKFRKRFVRDFLPPVCQTVNAIQKYQNTIVSHPYETATREKIHEIVDKAKRYFLKDVGKHSIFSVHNASRIVRRCVDKNKLSTEGIKELLENFERVIFGQTPLCESLENAIELFERDKPKNFKLLFVLSDGRPTDGSKEKRTQIKPHIKIKPSDDNSPYEYNEDNNVRLKHITSKLTKANVNVVSCFVTNSTDIQPKRLYDEIQPGWETGAKFMFSLCSHVPTQHLTRAILDKRGWEIDIANNETKLFIQVNHPDNLR